LSFPKVDKDGENLEVIELTRFSLKKKIMSGFESGSGQNNVTDKNN